jgi:hypothetical protein
LENRRGHTRTRQKLITCRGEFRSYGKVKVENVGGKVGKLLRTGLRKPKSTVLLKHIVDRKGNHVRHHAWFYVTEGFEKLDLKNGDIVEFDAVWIDVGEAEKLKIVGSPKILSTA